MPACLIHNLHTALAGPLHRIRAAQPPQARFHPGFAAWGRQGCAAHTGVCVCDCVCVLFLVPSPHFASCWHWGTITPWICCSCWYLFCCLYFCLHPCLASPPLQSVTHRIAVPRLRAHQLPAALSLYILPSLRAWPLRCPTAAAACPALPSPASCKDVTVCRASLLAAHFCTLLHA